jgi:DNA repair photolyase
VLHPSPVGKPDEVLSLNLATGCAHQCSFCSVRAMPSYPGDHVVYLYAGTVERVAAELAKKRRRPRAVYISPSCDPFLPLMEVQTETVRVVETLVGFGIESWLMTRGYIRPTALSRLAVCREHVRVTVGLTTLDRELERMLEPLTAPSQWRLRQIAELMAQGIAVQVALEPLIPGLTDTSANLNQLLQALAAVGVRRITAGYLYLRPGVEENLVRAFENNGRDTSFLNEYEYGPILKGALAAARFLPKRRRQQGYAALMSVAAAFGISVRISGVTNPDFQPTGCSEPRSRRIRTAQLESAYH